MSDTLGDIIKRVAPPVADGVFHVERSGRYPACYAGREASGNIAVLIRTGGKEIRTVPLKLAGIEARFSVTCNIVEPGMPGRAEILTAIVCLSQESTIEGYFVSIMEGLLGALGPMPTQAEVIESVNELVEIFQKLKAPSTRSLIGLIGELCVIHSARDALRAIQAWRSDPTDRYDFSIENLRLEAKASANRRRIHTVSLEQANPPPAVFGILASVSVEHSGGGVSLAELVERIERRIQDHRAAMKLRTVIADTLGLNLPASWAWSLIVSRRVV